MRFYDIHYHAFDLSHPNLLAFILREDLISKGSVKDFLRKLPCLMNLAPIGLFKMFPGKIAAGIRNFIEHDAARFRNLLTMMENQIEYHFLLTDYYLKKAGIPDMPDGNKIDKVVLCPLLMDFGYKNLKNSNVFYDLPPAKPVAGQVADLINAIRFYYTYDMVVHPVKKGQLMLVKSTGEKKDKLFLIFPFLGINTRNYDLLEIKALIDKYFAGYENDRDPAERNKKLEKKLGTVNATLEDLIFRLKEKEDPEYYSYIFAGIKLYPPLGFDPWPENEPAELDKVKFLYSECARKNIPLTIHCSDGGFKTSPDAVKFTDPARWKKILNNSSFRNLRINFAHMGNRADNSSEWLETIQALAASNKNVFTDFSCLTPEEKDYKDVAETLTGDAINHVLFGSDFLINLLWSGSYTGYLGNFIRTGFLTPEQKTIICHSNPERFLFGGPVKIS